MRTGTRADLQRLFSDAARTGNYEHLLEVLRARGQAGDGDAIASLAILYREGVLAADGRELVKRNRPAAKRYMMRAAEMGSPVGMTAIADHLTSSSRLSEKQLSTAIDMYKRAARKGYVIAAYNLAVTFLSRKRYRSAVAWFSYAARQGYSPARLELAKAQLYGIGTARNSKLALSTMVELVRDHQLLSDCEREQCLLLVATALRDGWLLRRDLPASLKYLREAAEDGGEVAAALLSGCPEV